MIGLVVPFVYWYGGKKWGVSSSLRHLCAATLPGRIQYFQYDWKKRGAWHLAMAAGMIAGGFVAVAIASLPPVVLAQAFPATLFHGSLVVLVLSGNTASPSGLTRKSVGISTHSTTDSIGRM